MLACDRVVDHVYGCQTDQDIYRVGKPRHVTCQRVHEVEPERSYEPPIEAPDRYQRQCEIVIPCVARFFTSNPV